MLFQDGEDWGRANIGSQTSTKGIGRYEYEYMGKDQYGFRSKESVGNLVLTDVGFSLLNGKRIDWKFRDFGSPGYNETTKERLPLGRGSEARPQFLVRVPRVLSIPFKTEPERDRFFVDLSRTWKEWKTKYSGFQFAEGTPSFEGETTLYRSARPYGCVVVEIYAAPSLFFYPKGGEVLITPPPPAKAWRDEPDRENAATE